MKNKDSRMYTGFGLPLPGMAATHDIAFDSVMSRSFNAKTKETGDSSSHRQHELYMAICAFWCAASSVGLPR